MAGPGSFFVALSLLASIGTPAPPPQHVIGGDLSPTCSWPSAVSLGGCTGTLIHPEVIVYAAHCGDSIPSVWFGETAFQGDGREVVVDRCVRNPQYELDGFQRHDDWAFCHLAEPVLDVPIVPPLMGCETTLLTQGRRVTLVGFGLNEDNVGGVKRAGETDLQWITEDGAVVAGDGNVGSCFGDSGGPVYLEMPDGSWRVFGIVSGGVECGYPGWYATVHTAVPMIEEELGIDVTPCHYSNGGWNPSPACVGFPTEPADGEGKTWAEGCAGGPVAEPAATCGPAYDDSEDLTGPQVAIVSPEYGETYESDESGQAMLTIDAEASDLPSGVVSVALAVNGTVPEGATDYAAPWQWPNTRFPEGVWELTVVATDWAGNETVSEVVAIGVDAVPPPAPEPPTGSTGTSSGGADDSSGDTSTSGDDEGTSTGEPMGSSGVGSSSGGGDALPPTGGAMGIDDDGGCTCTASDRGGAWGSSLLLLALLGLRRRRAATVLAVAIGSSGCGDDGSPPLQERDDTDVTTAEGTGSTSSSSEPSTSSTMGTSSSSTDAQESSSGSESSSSSGVTACEAGTLDCVCGPEFTCGADLRCELNTCIECPQGTQACRCHDPRDDKSDGTCDDDLLCVNGLCAAPPPCPFVDNGVCDENTGACFPGSDINDCCATQGDGFCEEVSRGGKCAEGTDAFDCCATPQNGVCEESSGGGECPAGSDTFDCCPTPQDGVCDEVSAGGMCATGSDPFDCCPTVADGTCEEMSAGGMCPDGSDVFDCCATLQNGTCEEMSAGGMCPDGSDVFDCCPTLGDGTCEEISAGGVCPDGSDVVDCLMEA